MPDLPDVLPVTPFARPATGDITLPGSKSLTNRALLLAALCDAPVTLTGALFSEDTHLMADALRALGFTVTASADGTTVTVENQGNAFRATEPVSLFVGLAGTAARFLTALCAAAPRGIYRVDGVPQMRKRPMKGLIDALRALGADIRCPGVDGFFPIEIHARGLRGGPVSIDASESSQMLSALLMVAPLAAAPVEASLAASVRWPFVKMTGSIQAQFGRADGPTEPTSLYRVGTGRYTSPGTYVIEPDATAASYYLALPIAVGGAVRINGLQHSWLQGDTRFIDVLQRVGLTVASQAQGIDVSWAPGRVPAGTTTDFSEFSDTFLTLAALAPLASGPTRISGIAHSRKQETDRVAGMARELIRLGQHVIETEDALEIHPRPLRLDETIETYGDHRFAMSFGILGSRDVRGDGRPWLSIRNPACCAKTFPHFFTLLESVRKNASIL